MSQRELTDEEKKFIKAQQDSSPVVKFFRTKNDINFSVGDFLIKVNRRNDEYGGHKWEPETISHVSAQPKRFVCIHEDEYGIKYLKPLTSMGKELPNVIQLTEANDWTRYVVDPEFAEHIILGEESEFDFSEKRKQDKARRDAITKKNKKIAERIRFIEQADALIVSLKPGSKIWFDYTIPGAAESEPWEVVSSTKKKLNYSSYGGNRKETYEVILRKPYTNGPGGWHTREFASESLVGQAVIRTEPYKYETV